MEYIYDALNYLADAFYYIKEFFASIPAFFMDAMTYCYYLAFKFYLYIKIQTVMMAYDVAQMLLGDYEVYTVLSNVFNAMPDSIRYAAYQLGVVQAVRIVIDAFATAFVLRLMGW
ncbi:DUF2523 family protein [Vibrio porteresiae]|uniref:DUF2523 family protein n=1 Tax=Vibrio porteresiae DSM 19223 TaxID=1123496 RepID=A0ABZ0QAG6_9VIBR|nr:DUF2523 family protein [Vibrio porteresiae]WPC72556.1 DUF2523 family protein [Vibrio porteresiae DSM 19223]